MLKASLLLFLISTNAFSLDISLGVFRLSDETQDKNGEKLSSPIEPTIAIGHKFGFAIPFMENHRFSPSFGYIKRKNRSNDSYGDYSKYSFYLLYDLSWRFSDRFPNLYLLYGFGHFMTVIKGKGEGTITVPNGSGTGTALTPSESSKSHTGSVNIGLEFLFGQNYSFKFETFIYSITTKQKRSLAYAFTAKYIF